MRSPIVSPSRPGLRVRALLALLASILPASLEAQALPSRPQERRSLDDSLRARRMASSVQLRSQAGTGLGSGVIVAHGQGGYWVATNRHVVEGLTSLCLITVDGRRQRASVVDPSQPAPGKAPDLAFLWFAGRLQPGSVARLLNTDGHGVLEQDSLPLVVASGHPWSPPSMPAAMGYQEREGLLLPLLRDPLEGGYALAYTSLVQKGMSGGGLFWRDHLIGLHGVHPEPLWSGVWKQEDGRVPDASLQAKLELVALAIPARLIAMQLDRLQSRPLPPSVTAGRRFCDPWPSLLFRNSRR